MAAIIEENQQNIFALAYRMTGNRDDALDITQETFVRAMENIRRFKGKASISTWLYSIAANLSRDFLRKNKNCVTVSLEEDWNPESGQSVLEDLDNSERRLLVRKAIIALPPKMRAAFILRYDKSLSISEIAAILHKSEGTIKAQLHEAVKRIRKILKIEE